MKKQGITGVVLLLLLATALAEDTMPGFDARDFSTRILGQERRDDHAVLVLQARARSRALAEKLGYTGIRSWFDTRDRVMLKVVLLDEQDTELKTIRFTHFEVIDGRKQAVCAEVTDHQQGKTEQVELRPLIPSASFM